jgi:hypothetical protein
LGRRGRAHASGITPAPAGLSASSGRMRASSRPRSRTSPSLRAPRGSSRGALPDSWADDVEDATITITVEHPTFEDWWEPFTLGVGPAGAYVAGLEPDRRAELRERCRDRLPVPPFTVSAVAWAARGRVDTR